MPAAPYIGSPGLGRVHRCIIQTNGKEHWSLLTVLFLAGGHYLTFDPDALDRVVRENEDELVVEANRFIDTLVIVVTNLQVFGRKPATDSFMLQISIEPFGKCLILAGMADEAGVVVNRLDDKRAHIGDEGIWNASFAEKYFWDISF